MTVTGYERLSQKYWLRSDSAKKTMKIKGKMFQFFSKTLLKIMKISQYKGYITTGRF